MSSPAPRPALRKAADGELHPAMPRWAKAAVPDIARPAPQPAAEKVAATPSPKNGKKKGKKAKKAQKALKAQREAETVKIVVRVPTTLKDSARRKAKAEDRSLDEAVAHLIQVWAGGRGS